MYGPSLRQVSRPELMEMLKSSLALIAMIGNFNDVTVLPDGSDVGA